MREPGLHRIDLGNNEFALVNDKMLEMIDKEVLRQLHLITDTWKIKGLKMTSKMIS